MKVGGSAAHLLACAHIAMTVGRSLGRRVAVAVVVAGMAGTGCTGANERCARGVSTTQLNSEHRRDRHTIRNLENEIVLLRAQLHDRPPPGPGEVAAAPVPPTPPPASAAAGEPLPAGFGDSPYGGEVEVVYEGEAAVENKNRPRIVLHETHRDDEGLTPDGDDAAVAPEAAPYRQVAPLPETGSERLSVVPGRIPTVDEQLRRARAATGAEGGVVASVRPASGLVPRATASSMRASAALASIKPSASPAAPSPAGSSPFAAAAATHAAEVAAGNPMADYRHALAALRAGKSDEAVAGLRSFLERFPRHYLADNVQFFLAESFYRRARYVDALGEYHHLVERYWRGNKLPDALLKIGLCELALGRHEAGVASLRRLVSRFPRTRPARGARARLSERAPISGVATSGVNQ